METSSGLGTSSIIFGNSIVSTFSSSIELPPLIEVIQRPLILWDVDGTVPCSVVIMVEVGDWSVGSMPSSPMALG